MVPSIPACQTCLTQAFERGIHEAVTMTEQSPIQDKLIQVMQEMIDTGELTFTPDGGAILRYPQPAATNTLFFSFVPDSSTVSGKREEFFPTGQDVGVLPQIYGALYTRDFPAENPAWKMSDFYRQMLN